MLEDEGQAREPIENSKLKSQSRRHPHGCQILSSFEIPPLLTKKMEALS